jgi:hypothetical protein
MPKTQHDWISKSVDQNYSKFFRLPPSVLGHPTMSYRKLQVLACLSLHSDMAGACTTYSPCLDRIAEFCNFYSKGLPDRSAASNIVTALAKDGWITVYHRAGINATNHYQLHQLPSTQTITDRTTFEYLKKADEKRDKVRADYASKPYAIGEAPDLPDEEPDIIEEEIQSQLDESANEDRKISNYLSSAEYSELHSKKVKQLAHEYYNGTEEYPDNFQLKIIASQARTQLIRDKFENV